MDPLGNVIKDFLKETRAASIRNAVSIASEFKVEGMTQDQIEEMLYASGFQEDIINDAIGLTHTKVKK